MIINLKNAYLRIQPHLPEINELILTISVSLSSSAASLDSSLSSGSALSTSNLLTAPLCEKDPRIDYNGLDFRIIVDSKSGPPVTLTLVASTLQEKAAWCSDIGQVSLHFCYLIMFSKSIQGYSFVMQGLISLKKNQS